MGGYRKLAGKNRLVTSLMTLRDPMTSWLQGTIHPSIHITPAIAWAFVRTAIINWSTRHFRVLQNFPSSSFRLLCDIVLVIVSYEPMKMYSIINTRLCGLSNMTNTIATELIRALSRFTQIIHLLDSYSFHSCCSSFCH